MHKMEIDFLSYKLSAMFMGKGVVLIHDECIEKLRLPQLWVMVDSRPVYVVTILDTQYPGIEKPISFSGNFFEFSAFVTILHMLGTLGYGINPISYSTDMKWVYLSDSDAMLLSVLLTEADTLKTQYELENGTFPDDTGLAVDLHQMIMDIIDEQATNTQQ